MCYASVLAAQLTACWAIFVGWAFIAYLAYVS
jgi:hypothetical protein